MGATKVLTFVGTTQGMQPKNMGVYPLWSHSCFWCHKHDGVGTIVVIVIVIVVGALVFLVPLSV